MLFDIRVLQIWVMETIIIYDFLHLSNLIIFKHNMDFGGKLAFANICHATHSFFILFSFKENGENLTLIDQTKKARDTPWFPCICLFHLVRAPNQGLINGYKFWACVNDCIII
jgi:hypothetical protein